MTGFLRVCVVLVMLACVATPRAFAQFSKAMVLLSGKVTDAESGEPLRAHVIFTEPNGTGGNKVTSNSQGAYQAVLKPGLAYNVRIVAPQRYVAVESIAFPASDKSSQPSHDFTVKPIHAGTVMFNDIAFDRGSVTPRSEAASAFAAIGKTMAGNNEIELSVEAFSDEQIDGSPVASDQGTQRADALKKLLIASGAAPNRVGTNAHNPVPPPPAQEEPAGKGKKKKKAPKKKPAPKKSARGKKNVAAPPAGAKATATITKVHSEDE